MIKNEKTLDVNVNDVDGLDPERITGARTTTWQDYADMRGAPVSRVKEDGYTADKNKGSKPQR